MSAPTAPVADVPAAFTETVLAAFGARPGPRFTLVLSGGPTALACYQHLAAAETAIDWRLVDLYLGDERVVPPDHLDANQRLVRTSLVEVVGPVGSFTPMPTTGPVERCVAEYQGVMEALLGGPGIDLIHLGCGPDGHTASLFPGAPTLAAPPAELVAATEDPNGRNPHRRLTLTLPAIDAARCAVFTVAGEAKREAVARLRAGEDLPAARVRSSTIIWLVDGAAFGHGP